MLGRRITSGDIGDGDAFLGRAPVRRGSGQAKTSPPVAVLFQICRIEIAEVAVFSR
jgi:hypothetical protein